MVCRSWMEMVIFIFLILFSASCSLKPKLEQAPEHSLEVASPTAAQPAIHSCFQYITNGNIEDFKKEIQTCATYANAHGMTTLMFAVYKNQKEIVDHLLQLEQVDVNAVDRSGDSALFSAVVSNRTEMVEALRAKGAKIKLNAMGVSPLWIALQNSRAELIFALSPTKEEVNLRGDDGWNAIYFAIRRMQVSVFNFILESGVDIKIKDSEGKSPLDFARDEVKWDYAVIWLGRD